MDVEITDSPTDGISSLEFHQTQPSLLLASSWDKSVRVYHVLSNSMLINHKSTHPILSSCFDNNRILYAGLNNTLSNISLDSNIVIDIGHHSAPICSLVHQDSITYTGSWDKYCKGWDQRQQDAIFSLYQSNKVVDLDVKNYSLIIANSNRDVSIYDTRNLNQVLSKYESPLKFASRRLRCFNAGFILSSIEGRVAVEYTSNQDSNYVFKCHRVVSNDTETVYPVHAIGIHPIHDTFATGGGDGSVSIWDSKNKKRIRNFNGYETSISALSFNCDGNLLAVASSYSYEFGEKDHPADVIFIKSLNESDVKPKVKKSES